MTAIPPRPGAGTFGDGRRCRYHRPICSSSGRRRRPTSPPPGLGSSALWSVASSIFVFLSCVCLKVVARLYLYVFFIVLLWSVLFLCLVVSRFLCLTCFFFRFSLAFQCHRFVFRFLDFSLAFYNAIPGNGSSTWPGELCGVVNVVVFFLPGI